MRSLVLLLPVAVLLVLFGAGCGGIDKGKLESAIKSQTNTQLGEGRPLRAGVDRLVREDERQLPLHVRPRERRGNDVPDRESHLHDEGHVQVGQAVVVSTRR